MPHRRSVALCQSEMASKVCAFSFLDNHTPGQIENIQFVTIVIYTSPDKPTGWDIFWFLYSNLVSLYKSTERLYSCVKPTSSRIYESVYYYLEVQYSWSIHPPRDQEPGPTRVVGRPKVVPTACNSWCIHRLCLMGECATVGTGAGRPDGPI